MKIFYGVQGTGNGHLSRARSLAHEFNKTNHQVDFLFSGRPPEKYFSMEMFGNYQTRKGLTFSIDNGKVNLLKTIQNNDFYTFLRDIDSIDLSSYDLIISDYEPITSWAARCQHRSCIGIGHQYAFNYDIPVSHSNIITRFIMKWFAPSSFGLGSHWDSFGFPIIPPIIDDIKKLPIIENKILVYLPFENNTVIHDLLSRFPDYEFVGYNGKSYNIDTDHIKYKNASREEFLFDLATCNGIICNAGFELISEALSLGKKILTKPVHGQMEQHSNAHALQTLGYATVVQNINESNLCNWLTSSHNIQVLYPNIASTIVNNIEHIQELNISDIWKQVKVNINQD